jgi:GNAT superfamily N-acetyltransferase
MVTTRELGPDELDVLFELPRRIYANDDAWVAPIRPLERRRVLGFVRRDRLKLWVAEQDGVVVGTMSALLDAGYNADKGEKVAWFGFFEVLDDPAITAALFERVRAQASEWGCTQIRGPRNLTRFEATGVTVDGHTTLPPFMQTHHKPWYADHIEGLGLVKHHDVLAYETPVVDAFGKQRELPEPLKTKAATCDVTDLVIRPGSRLRMGRDLRAAHQVLNEAFATVPDISPMPLSQWMALGRTYLTVAEPQLLQIAFSGDRPVAFAATFPELNEAIRAMHGRVLPLGWARTVLAARKIRTASFKLIGVVPDLRGSGLHARLIDHVVYGVKQAGYTRLEASVIDERNEPMRAVVEGAGMTVYRRYRVYQTEDAA